MAVDSSLIHENSAMVIGPPGCGKTTHLVKQASEAARLFGAKKVMVCSMTRAATAEVRSRELGLPEEQLGTLHAHSWRALGRPPLVTPKHIKDWNHDHPDMKLSGIHDEENDSEAASNKTAGDRWAAGYEKARATMTPPPWPPGIAAFAKAWEEWKRASGLTDFQDWIDLCLKDIAEAPGKPFVIYGDEAQDWSRSELELVRKWGKQAGKGVVLVGDVNQTIFGFRGACPEAFLDMPIPKDRRRVLAQSYRVPRAVHGASQSVIRRCRRFDDSSYFPRDADGLIRKLSAPIKRAESVVRDIEKKLAEGRSCMVLAACAYLLAPLLAVLRKQGLPFWNPYKVDRGDWNPICRRKGVVSASSRVIAFLERHRESRWTAGKVARWIDVIDASYLHRGGKAKVSAFAEQAPDAILDAEDFADLFSDAEADAAILALENGDLEWFESKLLGTKRNSLKFSLTVAKRRGPAELEKDPKLCVGTIHSVKGGEADVVYIAPDLSPSFADLWDGKDRDAILRLFYVGMTRAREELVLLEAGGPAAVPLWRMAS